jgi:hypothetical protein
MVVLVLAALGLMSALALSDAVQAWRASGLAEDDVRARAAALAALSGLRTPPDLAWLCLQPPHVSVWAGHPVPGGGRAELRWWSVGRGEVLAQVTGVGPRGGRRRWLAHLVPDSLPVEAWVPGCPDAQGLRPAGPGWLQAHPEG